MTAVENRFYRTPQKFLIWSEEHHSWWKAGRSGYTTSILVAGRYDQAEAFEIVDNANRYLRPGEPIKEIAMPDPLGAP